MKQNKTTLSSLGLSQIQTVLQYFSGIFLLHLRKPVSVKWVSPSFPGDECTRVREAEAQRSEDRSACSGRHSLWVSAQLPALGLCSGALGPWPRVWGRQAGNPSYSSEPLRFCFCLDLLPWTLYSSIYHIILRGFVFQQIYVLLILLFHYSNTFLSLNPGFLLNCQKVSWFLFSFNLVIKQL